MDNDDVVIVPARIGYPEYLTYSVYICQAGRGFREGLTHMGFYAERAIQTHVPRIRGREDLVMFTFEEAAARAAASSTDSLVGQVIETCLHAGIRTEGTQFQVFLLSGPNDPDTVHLARPIANDTVSASGKPFAWAMNQRYVSLANLTRLGVTVTSDLQPR